MALRQSDAALGKVNIPYPAYAGAVVAQRFTFAALTTNMALNDIIEMAPIPPNARVIDVILDSDDLDSAGPSITLDVGIMSGDWGDPDAARTVGAEFFAASTVAQAGTTARPTIKTAFRTGRSSTARSIGIKVAAAAAAAQAGEIGLTVYYAG